MEELARELREVTGVERVEMGVEVLKVRLSHGEYNSIPSDALSVIGKYDRDLYDNDFAEDFWLV